MLKKIDYRQARDLLLDQVTPVEEEQIPLSACAGRVLSRELLAREDVPLFDRSALDGYALRRADIARASREAPVTLRILEEVPAGAVPTRTVEPGTAVKILTGAAIPAGADTVIPYEVTEFTEEEVTLFGPPAGGRSNIVRAGEDVWAGQHLADAGTLIDTGVLGELAAQGVAWPWVYRTPRIGILSTGSELAEAGEMVLPGKIRNTNRYLLSAALNAMGLQARYLGLVGDREEDIANLLDEGLYRCDAVICTGGVSVGDYDRTPAAMERIGAEILIRGMAMKPGMACAFAVRNGKSIYGLSGSPAAAMTAFYTAVAPALRKLAGRRQVLPEPVRLTLAEPFTKPSPSTRFLRGTLDLTDGTARMRVPPRQGNAVINTLAGCTVMAEVPAGSGPLPAGTALEGFLLREPIESGWGI